MDKGLGDNGDRQRLVMVEISVVGPDRDFRCWVCVGVWENNKGKMKRKSQHKNEDKPSWLTHSKSISAQKIPTQSTLKPLGNQTHKSRKIYKSALKKKKKQNSLDKIRCQQTQNSLTPFDANNGGGFSVSRFCVDQSFLYWTTRLSRRCKPRQSPTFMTWSACEFVSFGA